MANETLPRRRRLGPGVILLLGVSGLLISLLLAGVMGWWRAAQAVEAELARIRAAGEPASADELETFYKTPPADQDTTQLWLSAFAPLDTPEFQAAAKDLPYVGEFKDPIPWPGEPWPQLNAAEKFLANNREPLTLMHRAAEKGGQARFPIRFADGLGCVSEMLQRIVQLRAAGGLLQLESAVASHRGNADAAIDSLVGMLAVARSLEQEPLVISQIVRISLDSIAHERLQWLLSASILDDEQLARLDSLVVAGEYRLGMRRALIGERVLGIVAFANPRTLELLAQDVRPGLTSVSDQIVYLQLTAELIAAANNPRAAHGQAIDLVQSRVAQLEAVVGAKWRYPLTLAMLSSCASDDKAAFDAADRAETHRDSARVAVVIERFQLRYGRLPKKLDKLVPEFMDHPPIDPFDGAPLRYRVDTKEYVVYSVGADGIDQGGKWEPPEDLPLDLVFRVRRKDADQRPDTPAAEPQP